MGHLVSDRKQLTEIGDYMMDEGEFVVRIIDIDEGHAWMDLAISEFYDGDSTKIASVRVGRDTTIEVTGKFYHQVHRIIRIQGSKYYYVTLTVQCIAHAILHRLKFLRKGVTEDDWETHRFLYEGSVREKATDKTVDELMAQHRQWWDGLYKHYHAKREKKQISQLSHE